MGQTITEGHAAAHIDLFSDINSANDHCSPYCGNSEDPWRYYILDREEHRFGMKVNWANLRFKQLWNFFDLGSQTSCGTPLSKVERVKVFTYLGWKVEADGNSESEERRRKQLPTIIFMNIIDETHVGPILNPYENIGPIWAAGGHVSGFRDLINHLNLEIWNANTRLDTDLHLAYHPCSLMSWSDDRDTFRPCRRWRRIFTPSELGSLYTAWR